MTDKFNGSGNSNGGGNSFPIPPGFAISQVGPSSQIKEAVPRLLAQYEPALRKLVGADDEDAKAKELIDTAVAKHFKADREGLKHDVEVSQKAAEQAELGYLADATRQNEAAKITYTSDYSGQTLRETYQNFDPSHKFEYPILLGSAGLLFASALAMNYAMLTTSEQAIFAGNPIITIAFSIVPIIGTLSIKLNDSSIIDAQEKKSFRKKVRTGSVLAFASFAVLTALRFKDGGNGSLYNEFEEPSFWDQIVVFSQLCSQFAMEALLGSALWMRITRILEESCPRTADDSRNYDVFTNATEKSHQQWRERSDASKSFQQTLVQLEADESHLRQELIAHFEFVKRDIRHGLN